MTRATRTITTFASSLLSVTLLAAIWHAAGWVKPSTESGYPLTNYFLGCVSLAFLTAYLVVSWFHGYVSRREVTVALGMIAPLPLALVYEIARDPTSHNLFPFEIALYWLPALGMAFAAATLGARMRRRAALRTTTEHPDVA